MRIANVTFGYLRLVVFASYKYNWTFISLQTLHICVFRVLAVLLYIDVSFLRVLLTFKKATAGGLLGGVIFTQGKHRCLIFLGTY